MPDEKAPELIITADDPHFIRMVRLYIHEVSGFVDPRDQRAEKEGAAAREKRLEELDALVKAGRRYQEARGLAKRAEGMG